jgi:hypothetical protein
LTATVLALAVGAAPLAADASTPSQNPTNAQISKAIKSAKNSKSLWATVNICNSKQDPNTLGIRGQMPSLGFPAWLSMAIQLNYWSKAKKKFIPIPSGGKRLIRLGRSSTGLQQDGASFTFKPHTGLLNASIQFIWRREGKLLGETTLTTTGGHPNADFGSPKHFTAKQCRIP